MAELSTHTLLLTDLDHTMPTLTAQGFVDSDAVRAVPPASVLVQLPARCGDIELREHGRSKLGLRE